MSSMLEYISPLTSSKSGPKNDVMYCSMLLNVSGIFDTLSRSMSLSRIWSTVHESTISERLWLRHFHSASPGPSCPADGGA
uniref:Uncharacterized protein n=1 Tax=Arundo donax TaxID=35708 RepID=A0A0A9D1R4_ARUDO